MFVTVSVLAGLATWIGYCWIRARLFRAKIRLRVREVCYNWK